MTGYLKIVLPGILAVLMAGCGGNRGGEVETYVESLANVEYFVVTPTRFVQNITLPIVVLPSREVNVGLTNGGRVTVIHADKGERVTTGQVLLETDAVLLEAQLDMAAATLEYQESEFARNEQLFGEGAIPSAQYDAAKLALAQARAGYEIARKQLAEATLRAPFDGVITMRNTEIGDMLSPAAPAFRIIAVDRVKIQAGIPERNINEFEVGNRVVISIDAIPGHEFDAQINYLSPEASAGVRTFLAEMEVNNREGLIRAGLMGNAHILQRAVDDALLIPLNAIIETEEGPVVFVLHDDDTVELRHIQNLSGNETMIQGAGLNPGERIVARGQHDLVDGERVRVTGEYQQIIDEENGE
ncbi:efflux RND transporter periplasmic adaptor subunit [Candidatus Latescibacterota bacterium]